MRLTRSIYNAVFGLVVFAALNVAAAPQVAVYRNWDNVQVNRLDIVDFGETESNVPISRLFRIENHGNTTMNVNVSLDTPNQKSGATGWFAFYGAPLD